MVSRPGRLKANMKSCFIFINYFFVIASLKETCTKQNYNCVFPFVYNGSEVETCLESQSGRWCGIQTHVSVYKQGVDFDYCVDTCPTNQNAYCTKKQQRKCILPFTYMNVTHTLCFPREPPKRKAAWCFTSPDMEDWGYCDKCPETDSIETSIAITSSTEPSTEVSISQDITTDKSSGTQSTFNNIITQNNATSARTGTNLSWSNVHLLYITVLVVLVIVCVAIGGGIVYNKKKGFGKIHRSNEEILLSPSSV